MKTIRCLAYVFAISLTLARASLAQEKDLEAKGEIQVGLHTYEMKAGEFYFVQVIGNGFMPNVTVEPGYLLSGPFDPNNRTKFSAPFVPQNTQKHTFTVLPNLFGQKLPGEKLSYDISIKKLPLNEATLMKDVSKLEKNSPRYERNFRKGFHKSYPLNVKKGEFYVVEMIRKGKGFFRAQDELDPYLVLEDANQKSVAQDDDGAGNLNSRIVYYATADANLSIIATTLGDNQFGDFTLTVRTTEKK